MLAAQIRNLRIKMGMTQAQLSRQLNIGPSAIGMYEQGRRTPSVDILIQMSGLFQVSLDFLITGTENAHEQAEESCVCSRCPCLARYPRRDPQKRNN